MMLQMFTTCRHCQVNIGPADDPTAVSGSYGTCDRCRKTHQHGTKPSWRADLDRYIRNQPARTPLTADPQLWDAFAQDRKRRERTRIAPYDPCVDCHRPMSPRGAYPDDYPGTIKHGSRGQCSTCRSRKQRTS